MKEKKLSPIRDEDMPLRIPGESLRREWMEVVSNEGQFWLVIGLIAVLFVGYDWVRWFFPSRQIPILTTILSAAIIAYSAWRFQRGMARARNLYLGLVGETSVGQLLEDLRACGYSIFHDVPGNKFNLDHVVVGRSGIFVIETKTRRKPLDRKTRVTFDGDVILVDGKEPDRNAIEQVRANRDWLQGLLKQTTKKHFPVKAAVVFPGWWVDEHSEGGRKSDVWVLNPTRLLGYIANESASLEDADVALVASRIEIHVRNNPPLS